MYAITIDIDWAPDELIAFARDLIDDAQLPATFFATHGCSVSFGRHEVALHPNLERVLGSGRSVRQCVDQLKVLFPSARGVRGHSLFTSTRFYPHYRAAGLEYESGHLCYGQHGLAPYWMIERIAQVPIFFEDDLHMELAASWGHTPFSLEDLKPEAPGLKVFVFHPVHLWLNTDRLIRYEDAKEHYKDPERLLTFRNTNARGTLDLFRDLLAWLGGRREQVYTVGTIQHDWRKERGNHAHR